jgi:hypothetical protein
MKAQDTTDLDKERDELRRLRDELFAQPPLELFDDPQSRERVLNLIDRIPGRSRRFRQV